MTERRILVCTNCEQVISGRVNEDGSVVLPLADNTCRCGNASFDVAEPAGGPTDTVTG